MTREELNHEKQREIVNEQRREKRKKITIFVLKLSTLLVIGFLFFYLYTSYVSTGRLIVKETRIVDSDLPQNFDGLKIVQISDLHYGTTVFQNEVKNVVKKINERKPDLVLFTGDLIDSGYELSMDEQEKIIVLLKGIDASLGKYAVPGEEDGETFYTIMKQSDFNILKNDYDFIYYGNNTPLLLVGLGSKLNDEALIKEAYAYFDDSTHNTQIYTISLAHEPDVIDEVLANYPTDLFLAGHSHNGNIRIPYFGAVYKTDGARIYDQAYYKINDTDLYISSGVGTNGPGFRLFCRPSINFFRMSSK